MRPGREGKRFELVQTWGRMNEVHAGRFNEPESWVYLQGPSLEVLILELDFRAVLDARPVGAN
jgi:hypothetical protein